MPCSCLVLTFVISYFVCHWAVHFSWADYLKAAANLVLSGRGKKGIGSLEYGFQHLLEQKEHHLLFFSSRENNTQNYHKTHPNTRFG